MRLVDDISLAWQQNIVDDHKQPQMVLLVSFLLTFALVRFITHSIRDHRFPWLFRNVGVGGTHLHHLVPGIILMMLGGYVGIALDPGFPREPVALVFGVGMALTLDEFALWLHLEDVYWAKEGRQSVDAVVIVATLLALGVLGLGFWQDAANAVARVF